MKNLIYIVFTVLVFLISCNTKKESKTTENTEKNTYNKSKLLTESELSSKNINELKLMRNEVYARKGYVFKTEELRTYFEKKEWYVPRKGEKITLSDIEKQNVNLIKLLEDKKKNNIIASQYSNQKSTKYRDTIEINYVENKKILDVLTLFPESDMGSWSWSQKDRIDMVEYIKKNNFVIDSTEMYMNIEYVKPNTFGISVVDGFWTLSIFAINDDNHIVITNDIVGDGGDINAYELMGNDLKPIKSNKLFGDYVSTLLKDNSQECKSLLEENMITFSYDFSNPEFIEIFSWGIDEEESDCFKGNLIRQKLNKSKRVFEIAEITWRENK